MNEYLKHMLKAIKQARGMYTDGKLSVDQFLAEKRAEEAGRITSASKFLDADCLCMIDGVVYKPDRTK